MYLQVFIIFIIIFIIVNPIIVNPNPIVNPIAIHICFLLSLVAASQLQILIFKYQLLRWYIKFHFCDNKITYTCISVKLSHLHLH